MAKTFPKGDHGQRTIVDAGCGEGRDTLFLLREGFHVIAVDASERNLRVLSRKVAEARVPPGTLEYHVADLVERIPVGDATADAVLDVWVLGSVILRHDGRKGARRYLAEAHRVLKPGGLFVSEFETLVPRCPSDKLKAYFAKLVREYFSVIASEAVNADYALYLSGPRRVRVNPALFVVARK